MTEQPGTVGPPLAGVRVLDFGHIIAGPYCARLLADLGADVVKVESSTHPEGMGHSHLGPDFAARRDRSPDMLLVNRNKRSIALNLKAAQGVAIARRLVAAADVVIENYSAGAMHRLGLGYDDLRPLNPGLIYLSMSGYGHDGPRRDWTSMNLNLQAYSGLMMRTGREGDPPMTIVASWNDYIGSLHGCLAILGALSDRARTGVGAMLDLAQFECSVASLGALLMAGSVNKSVPPRMGNRSPEAAPQGCYRCAGRDEWCALSVQSDDQWRALVKVIPDAPELRDARFASLAGRLAGHDEIDEFIQRWTINRSTAEVETCLKSAGIPAERMRRTQAVLEDAECQQPFQTIGDPPGGPLTVAWLPIRFGQSGATQPAPSPRIGQHTADVLHDWLGASADDVLSVEAEGVLV